MHKAKAELVAEFAKNFDASRQSPPIVAMNRLVVWIGEDVGRPRSRVSPRLEETAAPAGASHGEADLRGGDQHEVSGFRLFLGI